MSRDETLTPAEYEARRLARVKLAKVKRGPYAPRPAEDVGGPAAFEAVRRQNVRLHDAATRPGPPTFGAVAAAIEAGDPFSVDRVILGTPYRVTFVPGHLTLPGRRWPDHSVPAVVDVGLRLIRVAVPDASDVPTMIMRMHLGVLAAAEAEHERVLSAARAGMVPWPRVPSPAADEVRS
jgi:hypothetical protein